MRLLEEHDEAENVRDSAASREEVSSCGTSQVPLPCFLPAFLGLSSEIAALLAFAARQDTEGVAEAQADADHYPAEAAAAHLAAGDQQATRALAIMHGSTNRNVIQKPRRRAGAAAAA